jgi:hypothetical protein
VAVDGAGGHAWRNRGLRNRAGRSRSQGDRAWRDRGCRNHTRGGRCCRGRPGQKTRRDDRCRQRSHKSFEARRNHRGGLAGCRGCSTCRGRSHKSHDAGRGATRGSKPGGTTGAGWRVVVVVVPVGGSQVPMVETMEPDSKRKSRLHRLGEAAREKLSS